MRIPNRHQRGSSLSFQSAMTPLIDVVFQLLLFYMCISIGHLREDQLALTLPAGTSPQTAREQLDEAPLGKVWIRLGSRAGQVVIRVEGQEFRELAELTAFCRELAEITPEVPVILDIEPEIEMELVIGTYDACRAAGFRSIHFAADPSRFPKSR
jgi:biopolymer transport protein ExbD